MNWRRTTVAGFVLFLGIAPRGGAQEPAVFETPVWTTPESPIDRIVFRKLSREGIEPVSCSDSVFIRRAFLDTIGTLPTAREVRGFIEDSYPEKREALIDRLLLRDEFADYWTLKWGDLLRIKAEFPVNLWPNAVQAYSQWIRDSIRSDKPYNQFVRELLVSNGSNFRVGPVNFYRAMADRSPEGIASTVALTFMGTRTDLWKPEQLAGLAVFFSQIQYKPTREWKEQIVFWDPDKVPASGGRSAAGLLGILPDGTKIRIPPDRDPREAFADWLIQPRNPWFAPVLANRAWSWFLGRGLVHEPDDFRPDNPPSHPELLALLSREFVSSGYNLRHLFRLILNSRTYQASSLPPEGLKEGAEALFAVYPLRPLPAEALIDAINKITGASDLYTSPIPEPFTFVPESHPAIALSDGSITSPFLELFGRPARATGMENERTSRPSAAQRMHLLNSTHIQSKISSSVSLGALVSAERPRKEIVEELYLTVLSRYPTPDEWKAMDAYVATGVARGRDAWNDLVWALINSVEFRYRH
ncbi:MAG: DUF1553 domain-containing protein [Kiritimatiellia bacterium]|nr:DUF1553 domain-containing protein [Kiritimatiellia bacterium]